MKDGDRLKHSGTSEQQMRVHTVAIIIVLIVCWAAVELLIQPWGDFPLNDDWIYAVSVRTLLSSGKYELTGYTLNTALTHILSGTMVCSLLGFSFETLRLTNLLWSLITLVGTWYLLRQVRATLWLQVFATVTIAINPLFVHLSNSFMTDMCGLALAVVSVGLYASFWHSGSRSAWILAVLAATGSILARQAAILVPAVFPVGHLIFAERSRKTLIWAALPLLLAGAALIAYDAALKQTFGEFFHSAYQRRYVAGLFEHGPITFALAATGNFLRASLYFGGMLVPLCMAAAPDVLGSLAKEKRIFLVLLIGELAVISAVCLLLGNNIMPLADNIILDGGLGPVLLPSIEQASWRPLPKAVWIPVTMLCALGASLLWTFLALFARRIFRLARAGEASPADKAATLSFLVFALYTAVLIGYGFYDRYLTFAVPFLCVVVARLSVQSPAPAPMAKFPLRALSVAALIPLAIYSIAGTHDYFEWNRARWRALAALTAMGVKPEHIDGGMEFNCWRAFDLSRPRRPVSVDPRPPIDAEWLVAAGPTPGYHVHHTYPFNRWLIPGKEKIFVLVRDRSDRDSNADSRAR